MREICFSQLETLPRSGLLVKILTSHKCGIFVLTFLRHHFVGKPVVSLQNFGYFLRLHKNASFFFFYAQSYKALSDMWIRSRVFQIGTTFKLYPQDSWINESLKGERLHKNSSCRFASYQITNEKQAHLLHSLPFQALNSKFQQP